VTTRYQRALARLYALQARGIRLGATRMEAALALRGHPERDQVFIHVGGTNGKGSASAMIEACLRASGLRTGLFTSPHLHRYVERFRIDGKPIGDREATRRIEELLEVFSRPGAPEATFFELTTLLAIEAFRDHRCDVVVLEVGLGGRLDATNAVATEVSVITRIARDHTQVLGETLAKIAKEKAGILKRGTPAVIGVRDPSARRVIETQARRVKAPVHRIDRDFGAKLAADGRLELHAPGRELQGVRLALAGAHQLDNVACAFAALALFEARFRERGWAVPDAAIRRGLRGVRWPARLEYLPAVKKRPLVLLDAAHNLDGADALARHLAARSAARTPAGKRVLIFGALADKEYGPMLKRLAAECDEVIVCEPNVSRAAPLPFLQRTVKRAQRAASATTALARARALAGARGEVIVAGSIFLVAEARALLLGVRADPPIRM
jgi:dihydrofolate synthase/folylpolyglutamate synthase